MSKNGNGKGNGADAPGNQAEWVKKLAEQKGQMIREHIHKSGGFFVRLQKLAHEYCNEIPDLDAKRIREAEVHVSCMAYADLVAFSLHPGDHQARTYAAQALILDLAETQKRDPKAHGLKPPEDGPRVITDPVEVRKMGGEEC